jgi:uncharacterized membrane protein (DUF485 family)
MLTTRTKRQVAGVLLIGLGFAFIPQVGSFMQNILATQLYGDFVTAGLFAGAAAIYLGYLVFTNQVY